MSDAIRAAKPPAPMITRVIQLFGLAAIGAGAWAISTRDSCEELGCLVWFFGIYVAVWGIVAVLAGIRGPLGFVFLIGAIVLALVGSWVRPLFGLVFLVVLLGLVSASKERLAPYYRRAKEESP
jgi:MFS family permease